MKKVTPNTVTQRRAFTCPTKTPRYQREGPGPDEVGCASDNGVEMGSERPSPSSNDGDE
jgi:hypothetical protein